MRYNLHHWFPVLTSHRPEALDTLAGLSLFYACLCFGSTKKSPLKKILVADVLRRGYNWSK